MDNENLEGHWAIIKGKTNTFDNPYANISIKHTLLANVTVYLHPVCLTSIFYQRGGWQLTEAKEDLLNILL